MYIFIKCLTKVGIKVFRTKNQCFGWQNARKAQNEGCNTSLIS